VAKFDNLMKVGKLASPFGGRAHLAQFAWREAQPHSQLKMTTAGFHLRNQTAALIKRASQKKISQLRAGIRIRQSAFCPRNI
jgi:hypothetical protein